MLQLTDRPTTDVLTPQTTQGKPDLQIHCWKENAAARLLFLLTLDFRCWDKLPSILSIFPFIVINAMSL